MRHLALIPGVVALLFAQACSPPGKPDESDRYVRPSEVSDFDSLYAQNCSGCHGADGSLGPARPLADSLYLAFAGRDAIREVIVRGVPGTSMPAWSSDEGGPLSDSQLDALVAGMYSKWSALEPLPRLALPPYRNPASATASASRGAAAYATFCAECHGEAGRGGRAGSLVDPAWLDLVSDQMLRTSIVAGRTDLGMPSWRGLVEGRVMSLDEISDLVVWLRKQGRPRHLSKVESKER